MKPPKCGESGAAWEHRTFENRVSRRATPWNQSCRSIRRDLLVGPELPPPVNKCAKTPLKIQVHNGPKVFIYNDVRDCGRLFHRAIHLGSEGPNSFAGEILCSPFRAWFDVAIPSQPCDPHDSFALGQSWDRFWQVAEPCGLRRGGRGTTIPGPPRHLGRATATRGRASRRRAPGLHARSWWGPEGSESPSLWAWLSQWTCSARPGPGRPGHAWTGGAGGGGQTATARSRRSGPSCVRASGPGR